MKFLKKIGTLLTGSPKDISWSSRALTERELIEIESEIGRHIFGPIEHGHSREFFCLDENTWVWHEEWTDESKKRQSRTTRFEIHQNGILKVRDGGHYQYLEDDELENFGTAVRMYYEQVMRGIYRHDPYTGQSLASARSSAPLIQ
jgi:hypothetical protein